jgi:hypothetical protein
MRKTAMYHLCLHWACLNSLWNGWKAIFLLSISLVSFANSQGFLIWLPPLPCPFRFFSIICIFKFWNVYPGSDDLHRNHFQQLSLRPLSHNHVQKTPVSIPYPSVKPFPKTFIERNQIPPCLLYLPSYHGHLKKEITISFQFHNRSAPHFSRIFFQHLASLNSSWGTKS